MLFLFALQFHDWSDNKHHKNFEPLVSVVPLSILALSNVYTSRITDKATILLSYFQMHCLGISIMTEKVINVFNECPAICLCISPQKEFYTSSSCGDSKTYTFCSLEISVRHQLSPSLSFIVEKVIPSEIWRDLEQFLMRCLFHFLLSYIDDVLVFCRCIQRTFLTFTFNSLKYLLKSLCSSYASQFFGNMITFEKYNFH